MQIVKHRTHAAAHCLTGSDAHLIPAWLERHARIQSKAAGLHSLERFGPQVEIELRPRRSLRLPVLVDAEIRQLDRVRDEPAAIMRRERKRLAVELDGQ